MSPSPSPPNRQIRAHHDTDTITVYQAYSATIAAAAVHAQSLGASPAFSHTRMTWIKPSWSWMMYRSGYALKDARQTRILALKMTHATFRRLLEQAVVVPSSGAGGKLDDAERAAPVRVQWDPERGPRGERLEWRSIQIGIQLSAELGRWWVEEGIEGIEDVTERALALERVVREEPLVGTEELVRRGLVPVETEFAVERELRRKLEMDEDLGVSDG